MGLIDFIANTWDYVKENKHNLVVNILGLLFIVAIFSATLTSERGVQINYIEQQIGEDLDFSFNVKEYETATGEPIPFTQRSRNLVEFVQRAIQNNLISEVMETTDLTSMYNTVEIEDLNETQLETTTYGFINDTVSYTQLKSTLQDSEKFEGRFPQNKTEVMLIRTIDYRRLLEFQYEVGDEILLVNENVTQKEMYTVTIVGIYTPEYITKEVSTGYKNYLIDSIILDNPILSLGTFFVNSHETYLDIVDELRLELGAASVEAQFYFTLEKILDPDKFERKGDNVEKMLQELSWSSRYHIWRYKKRELSGYEASHFYYIEQLQPLRDELIDTKFISILLMVPALSITLFFSSYTFNIFFSSRKQQVGLLKTKGITTLQLTGFIFLESLASTLISLALGYVLGITIAGFTASSNQLLDFKLSFDLIDFSMFTFTAIMWWTLFIGIILTASRVTQILSIKILESRDRAEDEPFWKKFNLDIILFILAVLGNVFFIYLIFNPLLLVQSGLETTIVMIITLIFMPFPVLLLITGLLLLGRIIIPCIAKLATKIWHAFGNLGSYAITNLTRQKESTLRTILILAIVFSMIWAMFTVPTILAGNIERNVKYEMGTNCYYDHSYSAYHETLFSEDPNIESFSHITTFNMNYKKSSMHVMVIEKNFLKTAYFEPSFGPIDGIESIIADNEANTDEYPVLLDKQSFKLINAKDNQILTLSSSDLPEIDLTIEDKFQYWPRLVTSLSVSTTIKSKLKVVMSNRTYTFLKDQGYYSQFNMVKEGYYMKLVPDANITQMKEDYGVSLLSFSSEVIEDQVNNLANKLIYLQFNVLFIIVNFTTVFVIFLNGYKNIKGRNREISVERSLGMKLNQLSRLFSYESVALLGLSYLFGSILGILFSISISSLLIMATRSYKLPPPKFIFPFMDIHVFILLLMLFGIVTSLIPAWLVRKQNISTGLDAL